MGRDYGILLRPTKHDCAALLITSRSRAPSNRPWVSEDAIACAKVTISELIIEEELDTWIGQNYRFFKCI